LLCQQQYIILCLLAGLSSEVLVFTVVVGVDFRPGMIGVQRSSFSHAILSSFKLSHVGLIPDLLISFMQAIGLAVELTDHNLIPMSQRIIFFDFVS
jgi:hypothetical protein